MTLIVQELEATALVQEMVPTRNVVIEAVRPHICRYSFPVGSLQVQITDTSDVLVAQSEVIDISAIGTLAYYHGFVRFYINAYLKENVTYKFKLVGLNGYTFSESAYIGWVNGYDLHKYNAVTPPTNSGEYLLDLEIWEKTVK